MLIRPITSADIGRAAAVLAGAFYDDPFSVWLFPAHDRREKLVRSWTNQLRVVSVPRGFAFATPGFEGVTMWSPPGSTGMSIAQQMRLAIPFMRILGLRRLPAGAAGMGVIQRARPAEPHWYLSTIGVDPAHQRTGFGSALIRPLLERADADQVPVHLETFKPDNVAYYQRFGFEVLKEDDIAEGPHMWAMARRPQVSPVARSG